MKKFETSIGKLGLKDIWVLPIKTHPVEEPAIERPAFELKPVDWNREIPALFKPEKTLSLLKRRSLLLLPVLNLLFSTSRGISQTIRGFTCAKKDNSQT